jgi:hypothetical protein
VTTYRYDASNLLKTITDARDIVYLTNEPTNGRVAWQTLGGPGAEAIHQVACADLAK